MITEGNAGPQIPMKLRVDGVCATIILQRPHRGNALSVDLISQLQQAFEDLHRQKSVRAVVITGAGNAFSTGTDLHELHASYQREDRHAVWSLESRRLLELLMTMVRFPKPIIAAVNGPALGSGYALVAACDLVFASAEARFGCPEIERGLTAGMLLPLLTFRLGASVAARSVMLSEPITAERAHTWGLVHEVVTFDLLWAQCREVANQLSRGHDAAVALNKRLLNETVGERLEIELSTAAAAMAAARTTEYAQEGIQAFVEKRRPTW